MKQHKNDITAYTSEVMPDEAWVTVKDLHRARDKWQEEFKELQELCNLRGERMQVLYEMCNRDTIDALAWADVMGWFDSDGVLLGDKFR